MSELEPGRVEIKKGQPLQFGAARDLSEQASGREASDEDQALLSRAVSTIAAYLKACKSLAETKFVDSRNLLPNHIVAPSSAFVIVCCDGLFVRYDLADEKSAGKVRGTVTNQSLRDVGPTFSDQFLYFSDSGEDIPPTAGFNLVMSARHPDGTEEHFPQAQLVIVAPYTPQARSSTGRPEPRVSLLSEIDVEYSGILVPNEAGDPRSSEVQNFLVHQKVSLPAGWRAIEAFELDSLLEWEPARASMWAEIDMLRIISEANALKERLRRIDSRAASREYYAKLLSDLESLLHGPEEPIHQFLKAHPELLWPAHEACWSKVPFGNHVSDFVIREPHNDYLVVEIENAKKQLFRKDGQQREQLTHPVNQIADWEEYIEANIQEVRERFPGMSSSPRKLVVIGRSDELSEANRSKISTLQNQSPKLRIWTYDDLLANARSTLERLFGPLSGGGTNCEVCYFRTPPK